MVKNFIKNPPRWVRYVPLLHVLTDMQEDRRREHWLETAAYPELEEEYLYMTGKLSPTLCEDDLRVLVKRQRALQKGTLKPMK